MPFIDNGDGTITTEDGVRIAKPYGMGGDYGNPVTGRPAGIGSDPLGPPGDSYLGMWARTEKDLRGRGRLADEAVAAGRTTAAEAEQYKADTAAQMGSMGMTPSLGGGAGSVQPSASLIDAARGGGVDMRTASAEDAIKAALAPKAAGGGITLPDQVMTDAAPPPKFTRPLSPTEAARFPDPERGGGPVKPGAVGTEDRISGALGLGEAPLPKGLKPADRASKDSEGDTVSPEDRIQAQGAGIAMGGGPGMIAPRVIDKGGMRPFSRQIQEGTKLPPGASGQFDKNIEGHRAANQVGLGAAQDQNVEQFAAADIREREIQRQAADEKLQADKHNVAMQDAMGKFDAMSKEAREKPINQDSYFEEKGFGSKMFAGLMVAMNQVALRPGEKNEAKSIIDKQIDDWMADKKERRQIGLEGQRTAIGQMREQFQSESAQRAGLRAQAYEAYQGKLQKIAASASTEKEKAAAMQVDADLEDKKLDWKTKAAAAEADHVISTEHMTKPTVVGGMAPLERNLVVQDLNGRKYLARDAEQARDINQKHSLTLVARDAANTMARIANSPAGQKLDPNSTLGKEFGFAQEQFLNSMNTLAGQGVVRSEDIERFSGYTGGKYGLSTAEAAKKLASKATTAYSYTLSSKADTETPVAEDFSQNPKTGAVEKVAHYQMFPGGGGSQVPIAFTAIGKRKKAGGRK